MADAEHAGGQSFKSSSQGVLILQDLRLTTFDTETLEPAHTSSAFSPQEDGTTMCEQRPHINACSTDNQATEEGATI